uniref:Uncharacterized protein n=1 Tax=Arundo donax TaxID=35708 RepID=A0A0A8Z6Z1_ARUDO
MFGAGAFRSPVFGETTNPSATLPLGLGL